MAVEGIAAYVAGTKVYPLDGKGGYTTDENLAFVRRDQTSVLNFMFASIEAALSDVEVFHGDGSRALYFTQGDTGLDIWQPNLQGGVRLTGTWYVTFGDATPSWNFGFEVK